VTEGGQFTLCVQLTEMAFSDDYQYVKTKVKFSGEFHRSKSFDSILTKDRSKTEKRSSQRNFWSSWDKHGRW